MRRLLRIRLWMVPLLSVLAAAVSLAPIGEQPDARPAAARATTPAPPVPPTPVPTPAPTPVPVFTPERIVLPTLGVDAPIVPVGVESDGSMGTPGNGVDVGWWQGRRIGEDNALLAGHRDWNKRPGSFYRLAELKEGDPIVLRGEGRELQFHVQWKQQLGGDAEASGILGDVGHPAVTLITCGGVFDRRIRHYEDRVVVRAVLA